MEVRNCKKCGKVFAYNGSSTCPQCRKEEEEEYKLVKEYIYDHPGVDIQIVSTETGVEVKKILRYLREGKLELKQGAGNLVLDCERCGKAITTGKFCEQCNMEIQRELKSSVAVRKTEDKSIQNRNNRMYIADRHKK